MTDRTLPFRRPTGDDDLDVTIPRPRLTPLRLVRSPALPLPAPPVALPAAQVLAEAVAQRGGTIEVGPAAPPAAPWQRFEAVGLVDPAPRGRTAKAAAKLVVSSYRVLGIGILSLIVFVLIGYVGTSAFYYLSHTWVVPTIISPTDDKVVAARNELAAAQNLRGKLVTDLHDTERAVAVEQQFQLEFMHAVADDLAGRKAALDRVRALAGATASTRSHVRSTTASYATSFAQRQQTEYAAGLIDRGALMAGTYQVAQMSSSNLSLAEKQAELEGQAQELARQTAALDALLAMPEQTTGPISYDVLKIKRDLAASKLALAKALETRDTLTASLARQDEMIHGLQQSAYLRALADNATVALVPYGNLGNASPGASLYACKVAMVWCHEVGAVLLVLPGELPIRHPHTDATLRGQMIELRLTDAAAAEDEVLFVGGKPLAF